MLKDYTAEFSKGFDYGMNRAVEITCQDIPCTKKPEVIYHPRAFSAGEIIGKISAGAICVICFDMGSLGIIPLYNRHKNKSMKQTD